MKRFFSLFLVVLTIILMVTACSGGRTFVSQNPISYIEESIANYSSIALLINDVSASYSDKSIKKVNILIKISQFFFGRSIGFISSETVIAVKAALEDTGKSLEKLTITCNSDDEINYMRWTTKNCRSGDLVHSLTEKRKNGRCSLNQLVAFYSDNNILLFEENKTTTEAKTTLSAEEKEKQSKINEDVKFIEKYIKEHANKNILYSPTVKNNNGYIYIYTYQISILIA